MSEWRVWGWLPVEPDLRHEERERRGGDVEGGGRCTGGTWRGYKWKLLHGQPHDAAVGSWLCNSCRETFPSILPANLHYGVWGAGEGGSELGWRLEEGRWKMGACIKDEKTGTRALRLAAFG